MDVEKRTMLLFQLADSAFPIGGFAYSSGLESALKQGFLSDIEGLRSYLTTFAEQIISFDFPFIFSGFEVIHSEPNSFLEIKQLQAAYKAMLLNPPIQRASSITGINWMKILRQLDVNDSMRNLDKLFSAHQLETEFPVVFGVTMKACGFSLQESLQLFFYMSVRDQISAMIRLSFSGPSMAHRELKNLTTKFSFKLSNYKPVPYHQAMKSGYLLDLVQLTHDRVYSKLFQN